MSCGWFRTWFYLFKKVPGKLFNTIYYILASLVIFVGAGLSADLLWNIADITMGAMALINIPTMFILGKYAIRAFNDYENKIRTGHSIDFKVQDIDLPQDVDCWK